MNYRRLVQHPAKWVILAEMLTRGVGLLTLPVFTTIMSPADFGNFVYLVTLTSVIAVTTSLGLYGSINYYWHENEPKQSLLISAAFLNMFLVVSLTIILFSTPVMSPGLPDKTMLYFCLLSALSQNQAQLMTTQLFINHQYRNISYLVLIRFSLSLLAPLLLMLISDNSTFQFRFILFVICDTLVVAAFWLKEIYWKNSKFQLSTALNMLKFGFPIMLSSSVSVLYGFFDKQILKSSISATDLGAYFFNFTLLSIYTMIFSTIQNSWLPSFFAEKSYSKILSGIKLMSLYLSILMSAICLLVVAVNNLVIQPGYFNPEYYVDSVSILLMSTFLWAQSIRALINNFFAKLKLNYYGLFSSIISVTIAVLLMYSFNPKTISSITTVMVLSSLISAIIASFILYYKAKHSND